MERGSIVREIEIAASLEVVFDVVSNPIYIADWWLADTAIDAVPGSTGRLTWTDTDSGTADVKEITVVEAEFPRLFSFRWTHPRDSEATASNSLLVSFELEPTPGGTRLRMTETGFRERGWEAAVLQQEYDDHVRGWAYYLPRLQEVAEGVHE